ncbi:hypothetical protein G6W58_01255 [Streptomyces sp. KAI-27]|nr:hypothetical protein [Streptomyces sp. KAI-27]
MGESFAAAAGTTSSPREERDVSMADARQWYDALKELAGSDVDDLPMAQDAISRSRAGVLTVRDMRLVLPGRAEGAGQAGSALPAPSLRSPLALEPDAEEGDDEGAGAVRQAAAETPPAEAQHTILSAPGRVEGAGQAGFGSALPASEEGDDEGAAAVGQAAQEVAGCEAPVGGGSPVVGIDPAEASSDEEPDTPDDEDR